MNDDWGSTWNRHVDVIADAEGRISDTFQLPDWFVATYSVVATGVESGTATTTFTDGNIRGRSQSKWDTSTQWDQYDGHAGLHGHRWSSGTEDGDRKPATTNSTEA